MLENLTSWLFETGAVRVCPQDRPFWYTSGTIGPYYINTHFLYGSEIKANELLAFIDREKSGILSLPVKVLEETRKNYREDPIYRGLMDGMIDFIRKNLDIDQVAYISGGERRDWFFSLLAADILQKPHITIYKDLKTVLTMDGRTEELKDLKEGRVLHIADLINEASSYERAWIPAIRAKNGSLDWSVVVVDRKQGGGELLAQNGVLSLAMVEIGKSLFESALSLGKINKEQYAMIADYLKDPKTAMRNFMLAHPGFLKDSLAGDPKTRERAELCIRQDFYGLKDSAPEI